MMKIGQDSLEFLEKYSVIPVIVLLTILQEKRRRKKMAIKTMPVLIKDGQEGRGVKVSARNYLKVTNWIEGAEAMATVTVSKTGVESDQRVKLKTVKGIRVARIGDVVVRLKDGSGYLVIKADDFAKYVTI